MSQSFQQLFEKKKNILSIYFTAGYPRLEDTTTILNTLQKNGVDCIEIGIPYSDPLADGPVIQASGVQALNNGMTIKKLFEQLKAYRAQVSPSLKDYPLVLMGYFNPVLQFGIEKFCQEARDCGISGVILPDLPLEIYERDYKELFAKYDLDFIFLITPQTSEERIRKIDALSTAFIYVVSSSSITGGATDMEAQAAYFTRIKNMNLRNKLMIGFGIKDKKSWLSACEYAAGGIIGTAFIKSLENGVDPQSATKEFLNAFLEPFI